MENLQSASRKTTQLKKQGKTIGLTFGGFDLLYYDHIRLFLFAKKHVDVLVVGVETDKTVHTLKGKNRPTETQQNRINLLAQLKPIDIVFALKHNLDPREDSTHIYTKIVQTLKADALITNPLADQFYTQKMHIAKALNIKFLPLVDPRNQSFASITRELKL